WARSGRRSSTVRAAVDAGRTARCTPGVHDVAGERPGSA
ncbi:MAG: hypothetical protein AVDCRST_MAG07-3006, partial [uncultured Frankineae bacterium]